MKHTYEFLSNVLKGANIEIVLTGSHAREYQCQSLNKQDGRIIVKAATKSIEVHPDGTVTLYQDGAQVKEERFEYLQAWQCILRDIICDEVDAIIRGQDPDLKWWFTYGTQSPLNNFIKVYEELYYDLICLKE